MPFPETREQAEAQGYRFLNNAECSGCGRLIAWFSTPKGKKIPIDRNGATAEGVLFQAHFASCPKAARFKTKAAGQGG